MLNTGLLPRDAGTHRTPQPGGVGAAAPPTIQLTQPIAATGPLTRPVASMGPLTRRVALRGAPTGFRLFEALMEPSAAVIWLAACAWLGGDSFGSRYLIVATIAFSIAFPGAMRFNDPLRVAFAKALRAAVLLVSALALIGYATGYADLFPSQVALAWATGLPFALTGCQYILRQMLPQAQRALQSETSVVICGANAVGLRLANHFLQHRDIGGRLVGFFDDRDAARLAGMGSLPLLGKLKHMADFVKRNKVQQVFVTLPMASQPRVLKLIDGLRDTTASIYFVPDIFITPLVNGHVETLSGLPVISVCDTPFRGVNRLVKRLEDIVVASLALVLTSPLLLAVAIGVRLSGPGPILFRQRRYGLDGRDVWVYKFRSMCVTEDGDQVFRVAARGDPRITRFGAFIRRTSLDELPQLLNVLQGRMSVVGPRPHAVAMNEEYRRLIPSYMLRHKVKPGITGLAQIRGYRGGSNLEQMRKRIACDIEYLRRWSPALDLWIILRTIAVVLRDQRAY
jgi:putative colanic acid biosysnthesis UDP-glucose lipid carrier transferase